MGPKMRCRTHFDGFDTARRGVDGDWSGQFHPEGLLPFKLAQKLPPP